METPDKAADLAHNEIANAVNRDWLLVSGRSDQLLGAYKRKRAEYNLIWGSQNSNNNPYGAIEAASFWPRYSNAPREILEARKATGESSWLLRHYTTDDNIKERNRCSNNQLYDNISFVDSPLLTNSLSWKLSQANHGNPGQAGDVSKKGGLGCFFGLFRIFLSCYLLLGITLAIYSRNALSLAVVGMVANNKFNSDMLNVLGASNATSEQYHPSDRKNSIEAYDGSCPIVHKFESSGHLFAKIAETSPLVAPSLYPSSPAISSSDSSYSRLLEEAYMKLMKERVERGELVDWSPSEQGLIFAAGSVGNLLIAIPITRMGEIYGSKWIIFAALFGATIQAALMPLISPCNIIVVILFQVIFCGLTFGADCVAYTFFAHWLTPTEMAFFVSCLLICYQMGNIISSFVTASILSQGIAWSWCFYAPAILCGIWTLVWVFIGASEPLTSGLISRNELDHLARTSKITELLENHEHSSIRRNNQQVPDRNSVSWLKLAKDRNIWAIIAVKFTLRWYFSVNASLMPTYLSSVTHMSVDTIGKMSVFQSFICLFSGILMGYLTKSVIHRRPFNLSLAAFRKVFQSIVNFGLSGSLLVFIAFDCNQWVTIAALTMSGICLNFYVAAALQLPLDLSPSYCGLITSISNTLALGQALGAPISGLILNYGPKDRALWRYVWGLVILLNTFSGLLFIFLVDSKPRDYSKCSRESQASEEDVVPKEREMQQLRGRGE